MKINLQNYTSFMDELQTKVDKADDANFWKKAVIEATKTILSVLSQLDKQNLLFTPEGKKVDAFGISELAAWFDLVSLKSLAFIIDESNQKGKLVRVGFESTSYDKIDLEAFSKHLLEYGIELKNELDDFPNRFYVRHLELGEMIKRFFK